MALPTNKRTRGRRAVPRQSSIFARGACEYFGPKDGPELEAIVGKPLRISADSLAADLNFMSENFLIRYAHDRVPTAASKSAEWCSALARSCDALLGSLGITDRGYPAREMPLDPRVALTHNGTPLDLNDGRVKSMRMGDDLYDVLDRVPAALWTLKKVAENAAGEYQRRAAGGQERLNARQPQHVFLLGAMGRIYEHAFGVAPPDKRPNHEGPFIKAVDFVRRRIIDGIEDGGEFTAHGTDGPAAKRLRQFTPMAAARLWTREHDKVTNERWFPRFDAAPHPD